MAATRCLGMGRGYTCDARTEAMGGRCPECRGPFLDRLRPLNRKLAALKTLSHIPWSISRKIADLEEQRADLIRDPYRRDHPNKGESLKAWLERTANWL